MKINISINELLQINESARALKQSNISYIRGYIIGIDDIKNYIIYTRINSNLIPDYINYYNYGLIINAKEMSAFCKSLTNETKFEIDTDIETNIIYSNMGSELSIHVDTIYSKMYLNKVMSIYNDIEYNRNISCIIYDDFDITEDISPLYSMKKADGIYTLKFVDYFITLFPGLLPLTKSDKVFMTIMDKFDNTFICKFTVKKKKMISDIIVYVAYIKIPK